ncbi:hypothetical protein OG394_00380 [Kribbella sp. NBC_01245]|uniref:hypothetical protein n=1 Tax=Kribbella sp. NBC_01245 TaxID=2903578 RepID=UPI002E2B1047|nr:hypothetical protein [Kribbella sp. NBC_01245]
MIKERLGKWGARSVALAIAVLLMSIGLSAPASAGTCTTQGCGGEVSNNTGLSIRIANCWSGSSSYYYGDTLPCVQHPNTWVEYNADVELPAGDESKYHYWYYDTDAVRFFRNCVTKWHYWGGWTNTVDRRGKSSQWMKFSSLDHIYIDSQVCY